MIGRNQRAGDAGFFIRAEQVVRIECAEREAEHGRDRSERDVALVPVQGHAEHALALPLAPGHHAFVDHGGGVGAGLGAGQAEGRHLAPVGQAGQPVVALGVGAEAHGEVRSVGVEAGDDPVGHVLGRGAEPQGGRTGGRTAKKLSTSILCTSCFLFYFLVLGPHS